MGIAAARQRHQRAGHRRDQALGTVRLGVGRARLKALIELYSERMNTEGMAIELAIRLWARSDPPRRRRSDRSMRRGSNMSDGSTCRRARSR
ncbi:hypothetical protein [Bradyrhizobium sp.]|uniref:hypothetical protein n=1 Tax=Bradyrhizobium sp. TaxID=376 RepID=UPI0025BF1014|nr:hypothetical protein [Bradyrhizobium sp.]